MTLRTLAIDTVTPACSTALFEDGELVASEYEEIGRGHAEKIVPMIKTLLDKGRADHILVNCGPGSFTGVRIGMSVANALGLAWQSSVSGYQCLHLVAAQALSNSTEPSDITVAMHGGHGEFFVQNFNVKGIAIDEMLSLPPEKASHYARSTNLAGSAATDLAEHLVSCDNSASHFPDAAKVFLLAQSHRTLPVSPIYGREADAVAAKRA